MKESRKVLEESSAQNLVPYERKWTGTSRVKSILALTHPTAVLVFTIVVLLSALIAERGLPNLHVLIQMIFAMAFAQSAIGIANEICDYELDRATKPWRALPAGLISRRAATRLAILASVLGLFVASSLSIASMLLLAFGIGIGVIYSLKLKRTILSWVPYAVAYPSPPVWVSVSLGKFDSHILLIYFIALPFAIVIHLCNQLRDFDEDAVMGIEGLVQHLGKRNAVTLCFALLGFCPLPAMVFGLALTPPNFTLALAASLHWALVIPYFWVYRSQPNPEVFRNIFRRLQLTVPLLLFGWLVISHI